MSAPTYRLSRLSRSYWTVWTTSGDPDGAVRALTAALGAAQQESLDRWALAVPRGRAAAAVRDLVVWSRFDRRTLVVNGPGVAALRNRFVLEATGRRWAA